jgi:hypothetical protein
VPANRHFVVVCPLNTRTHFGHICGTRGAQRRLATPSDAVERSGVDTRSCKSPANERQLLSRWARR